MFEMCIVSHLLVLCERLDEKRPLFSPHWSKKRSLMEKTVIWYEPWALWFNIPLKLRNNNATIGKLDFVQHYSHKNAKKCKDLMIYYSLLILIWILFRAYYCFKPLGQRFQIFFYATIKKLLILHGTFFTGKKVKVIS